MNELHDIEKKNMPISTSDAYQSLYRMYLIILLIRPNSSMLNRFDIFDDIIAQLGNQLSIILGNVLRGPDLGLGFWCQWHCFAFDRCNIEGSIGTWPLPLLVTIYTYHGPLV
jgi:hypothetical protein